MYNIIYINYTTFTRYVYTYSTLTYTPHSLTLILLPYGVDGVAEEPHYGGHYL